MYHAGFHDAVAKADAIRSDVLINNAGIVLKRLFLRIKKKNGRKFSM